MIIRHCVLKSFFLNGYNFEKKLFNKYSTINIIMASTCTWRVFKKEVDKPIQSYKLAVLLSLYYHHLALEVVQEDKRDEHPRVCIEEGMQSQLYKEEARLEEHWEAGEVVRVPLVEVVEVVRVLVQVVEAAVLVHYC